MCWPEKGSGAFAFLLNFLDTFSFKRKSNEQKRLNKKERLLLEKATIVNLIPLTLNLKTKKLSQTIMDAHDVPNQISFSFTT